MESLVQAWISFLAKLLQMLDIRSLVPGLGTRLGHPHIGNMHYAQHTQQKTPSYLGTLYKCSSSLYQIIHYHHMSTLWLT